MYLDGVSVDTSTDSLDYAASPLRIGAWSGTNNYFFTGSMDSVKIYKGFAKYTSNFNVGSTPESYLPGGHPTLTIENKYNNILKEYTINMTSDDTRIALTGSN